MKLHHNGAVVREFQRLLKKDNELEVTLNEMVQLDNGEVGCRKVVGKVLSNGENVAAVCTDGVIISDVIKDFTLKTRMNGELQLDISEILSMKPVS